jgi:phosphate transport system permease protein
MSDQVSEKEKAARRQPPQPPGGGPLTPRPSFTDVRQAAPGAETGTRHPAIQRDPTRFAPRLERRHAFGSVFAAACVLATLIGIFVLFALLIDILRDGAGRLSREFLTGMPSRFPGRAGIAPALVGSAWTLVLTAVVAFPLGVGTAIWLEEYARQSRFKRLIETNIANLAGVPSIVYGILGLALFVRAFALGRSILAASFTLALLILPVIIIASQEAIKAVPGSIRLGAYALGATKWETIRHHVFPMALPGILTGTILALSRAVGEAAPVILVGALAFIAYVPNDPMDQFTVIPFQIFSWVTRPQAGFHEAAAAASIVLLVLLLTMNAAAIWLRNRYTRRY